MLRAVLLIAVTFTLGVATAQAQQVLFVDGPVEIGSGEPPAWRPAQVGDTLSPGDSVRTGYKARAELDLGSGTVKLYENSLLRLPSTGMGESGANAVEQEQGTSLFNILRRGIGEDPFKVKTPEAVVMVKGTQFSVSVDTGLATISVFSGLVGVTALEGPEVLVRPGLTATGGRDAPFELTLHNLTTQGAVQSWSDGDGSTPEEVTTPDSESPKTSKQQSTERALAAAQESAAQTVAEAITNIPAAPTPGGSSNDNAGDMSGDTVSSGFGPAGDEAPTAAGPFDGLIASIDPINDPVTVGVTGNLHKEFTEESLNSAAGSSAFEITKVPDQVKIIMDSITQNNPTVDRLTEIFNGDTGSYGWDIDVRNALNGRLSDAAFEKQFAQLLLNFYNSN